MNAKKLAESLQAPTICGLTVESILGGLVRHLGGVDEFCKHLALDYMKAKPGSPTRQRIGQLIVNLSIAHARIEGRTSEEILEHMTTEQLESLVADVIRKHEPGATPKLQEDNR